MHTNTVARKYKAFNFTALDRMLDSLSRENVPAHISKAIKSVGLPLTAIAVFLMFWSVLEAQVQTSLCVLQVPA